MTHTILNLLTDIAGIAVGHATDLALGSGVTAILFDRPAVASIAVAGGAPGGRDTHMLEPGMTVETVDAIVLSGGSVYGLDAAGGVQAALREAGRGTAIGGIRIPIAPQAIIFDLLNGGNKDWGRFSPYRDLGYAAAAAAQAGPFGLGSVGAGTGATTATVKGGLGSASMVTQEGHTVAALAVVNALGAATIGDGPHFWAAPFEVAAEFGGKGWPAKIDTALRLKGVGRQPDGGLGSGQGGTATTIGQGGTATTIGLIVTDAVLTRPQAKRLAVMAHDGLARAILLAHAPLDGDTIFSASTGVRTLANPIAELTGLGHAATLVMARAIARGVYAAGALPVADAQLSWQDRHGR